MVAEKNQNEQNYSAQSCVVGVHVEYSPLEEHAFIFCSSLPSTTSDDKQPFMGNNILSSI